ncbi:hypothetical protein RCL1_001509 [Eukaryota sp. TZLM3-RCL]
MRILRNKKNRKAMEYYRVLFGFPSKPRVLIHWSFVSMCQSLSLNTKDKLSDILGNESRFFVTNCLLQELKSLGPDMDPVLRVCRSFPRHQCGHDPHLSSNECLSSVLGEDNNLKFYIALNDALLQSHLSKIPCIPLIKFNGNVIIISDPSPATRRLAYSKEQSKLSSKGRDLPIQEPVAADQEGEEKKKRKRRGPPQPNPLSCLPPKKKSNVEGKTSRVRTRTRDSKAEPSSIENDSNDD